MSVEKEVRDIIKKMSEKKVIETLPLDAIIKDKTDIDSLDMVESILAIEDHFKIILDDGDMNKIKTLKDFIGYIEIAIKKGKDDKAAAKPVPQDDNPAAKTT